ncbi:Hypothetical predicted protein, partial [Pelobates cultripes]
MILFDGFQGPVVLFTFRFMGGLRPTSNSAVGSSASLCLDIGFRYPEFRATVL